MGKTLILAEPGCTSEGEYAAFVALIHTAADAGADVFKAQWCSDTELMLNRRHITPDDPKFEVYRQAYSWLNFDPAWHADFARMCGEVGIAYACTSYLPKDVWAVDPFVSLHKISSFEAADSQLVQTASATGKRVIISTGMQDGKDIAHWWTGDRRNLLHCVTQYPADLSALNHRALREFSGLSDHSRHLLTGAVAVGAGAQIIETHYRLHDCSPSNPDYAVAFNPDEFKQYIANIRAAEEMLGDGIKKIQPCEEAMLKYRVTS